MIVNSSRELTISNYVDATIARVIYTDEHMVVVCGSKFQLVPEVNEEFASSNCVDIDTIYSNRIDATIIYSNYVDLDIF